MGIKVNKFADAFLNSYVPGAQQGAAQWQALQRQKAQEEQFMLERADATQRYEQEHALRQGQLANQTAQNTREQTAFDNQQADVRTAAQGAQSLAAGVPDPRKRIADIGGMFKSPATQQRWMQEETGKVDAQDLKFAVQEAGANPAIASDPVLAPMLQMAAQAAASGGNPGQVLSLVKGLYEQAGKRQSAIQGQGEYQSRFDAGAQRQLAIADALDAEGEYEQADAIYERVEQAREQFAAAGVEPAKAREAYNKALSVLRPGRSGTSKNKDGDGPLAYRDAYKAAQGGISAADVKALNTSMREVAYDEVIARGGSEEEAEKAAKKVRSVTLSEMHDREAERLVARDARDRKGPQQSAQQAPQQMNGAAAPQQMRSEPAAEPLQPQAEAQALPPAEFIKRKPEEQQSFLSEIEADLRDGGGTNLEAIYQKYGVVPGSLPSAVKARLKRAAGGG